jgi:hypothetical protein
VNEIEPPAYADEQSAISTTKNHNRFIGTSAGDDGEKLDGGRRSGCDLNHRENQP